LKENTSFKVILFSGAKKFTLSDYKTRATASPTQLRGEREQTSGGAKCLTSFFPNLMIIS